MLALVPKLMLGDVFFGGSPSLATGRSLSGLPGFRRSRVVGPRACPRGAWEREIRGLNLF